MRRTFKKSFAVILAAMMLLSITQMMSFAWNFTPPTDDLANTRAKFTVDYELNKDADGDGKISKGDTVYLIVKLHGITTYAGGQTYFNYDPTVLKPVNSTGKDATSLNAAKANPNDPNYNVTANKWPADESAYEAILNEKNPGSDEDPWSADMPWGAKIFGDAVPYINTSMNFDDPNISFGQTFMYGSGVVPYDGNGERIGHMDLTPDQIKNGLPLISVRFQVLRDDVVNPISTMDAANGMWDMVVTDMFIRSNYTMHLPTGETKEITNGQAALYGAYPDVEVWSEGVYNALDYEFAPLISSVSAPADFKGVDAAIAAAEALNSSLYTNFDAVTAAVTAAKALDRTALTADDQATVDAAANAINNAIAALVYKTADYAAVDAAIAAANALVKDNYVDFSAVDAAVNAVERDKDITKQAEVNAMAAAINSAISALVLKDADYTAVDAAIAAANALVKDDYVDFSAVDAAVSAVVRGKDITKQAEVNAMAAAINDAIAALELKPVVNYVNITAVAENGTVSINDAVVESGIANKYVQNSQITLSAAAAEGYEFVCWLNGSNKVLPYGATFNTNAAVAQTYTAVFKELAAEKAVVTFYGLNKQVLKTELVTIGGDATAPEAMVYDGYTFKGWSKETTAITEDTDIYAMYDKNEVAYTVTAGANVLVNGETSVSLPYNTRVVATVTDLTNFVGWSLDGGNTIISYATDYYMFYVGANVTVTAVYDEHAQAPTAISAVTSVTTGTSGTKGYVAILTERSAPEGYTLVSAGVIYTKANVDLTVENANNMSNVYVGLAANGARDGQFKYTITATKGTTVYYNSFAIYQDASGVLVTVYGTAGSAVAGA